MLRSKPSRAQIRRARHTIGRLLALVGVTVAMVTTPWMTALPHAGAQTFSDNRHDPLVQPDQPYAGLHFGGLRHASETGPCRNALQVSVASGVVCSHGPDAAPASVDVTKRVSTASLRTQTRDRSIAQAAATSTPAASTAGTVYCYDDGTSGNRVEAIYAHAAGVTSRYTSMLPTLRQYAATADGVYNNSAVETGGVRHIRFVTDSTCNLIVRDVTLTATGDDSFGNTVTELRNQGYNRTDRDYMVWVDANVYCGIGSIMGDDRAGSVNSNMRGGLIGRTDTGCWGGYVESHELMHNLGGVQQSAPHASGGWHCFDDADRMCYSDGGTYFKNGGTLQQVCPSSHEYLFDCNHDDYFSTNPPAGSYLATHWNVAGSPFLATAAGSTTGTTPTSTTTTTTRPPTTTTTTPPPTTTTRPPTTTTTTRPPTTTTTAPPPTTTTTRPPTTTSVAYSGTTTSAPTDYVIATGTGTLSCNTTWSGGFLIFAAPQLTVTIRDASGRVLSTRTGSSPLALSAPVARGVNSVSVSGQSGVAYQLSVTYPRP